MASQPPKKPANWKKVPPNTPLKKVIKKAAAQVKKAAAPAQPAKPAKPEKVPEILPPPQGPTGVPLNGMRRPTTITLTEQVELPQEWPPKNSGTMSLLTQAIGFVADGQMVTPEFVEQLKRMLSSMEERMEMVNVVLGHHQMHRLQKLHAAVENVEAIMLNPAQLAMLDADQMLRLMSVLYAEVAMVNKVLGAQAPPPNNPETVHAAVDPAKIEAVQKAREAMGNLPAQTRRTIREALARTISQARKPLPPAKKS